MATIEHNGYFQPVIDQGWQWLQVVLICQLIILDFDEGYAQLKKHNGQKLKLHIDKCTNTTTTLFWTETSKF